MNKLHFPGGRAIVLGLLVLIASVCHGQTTATVTGTVKDAAGAVLPQASVTATNTSTGIVSKTTTNRDGVYRIENLVIGVYTVEASRQGFKNLLKDLVELNINDVAQIDFAMQVGAVTESVTIDASGPLIETETATLGETIQGREIQEAPLNGRNVMNLLELVPGVVVGNLAAGDPASNQGSNNTAQNGFGAYNVGGGGSGSNQTYLDGVSADTSGTAVGIIPSTDSISEFRVDTNAISPQFGAFGGGVISFSTKSGTNAFHGTAFEYVRNTFLDANTWFNDHFGGTAAGFPVSILHQNQYGGTVGGPIVKKKAFFFFSYAGTRLSTFAQQEFWAPTPAEMNGDFTADYGTTTDQIGDYYAAAAANMPTTTANAATKPEACAGGGINKICPAHLSPFVQKMFALNYYNPIASNATQLASLESQGYNQTIASAQPNNENQYVGRVDYTLSDKQSLFARTTYWTVFIPNCTPCKMPALPTQPTFFTSQQDVVGDHYTLNASTAFDLRLGWIRWSRTQSSNGNGKFNMAQFGPQWATIQSQLTFQAPPDINQSTSWTNTPYSIDLYALGQNDTYSILGSMTKVSGHHLLQFGGEARRVESYSLAPTAGTQGGGFTFTQGLKQFPNASAQSGNKVALGGMAEMLVGAAEGGSIATTVPTEAYSYYQGYYANDTWKVMPKLTVNLGLRWELPGASADKHNYTSVFLANVPNPIGSFANPLGASNQLLGDLTEVASPLYPSKWTAQVHYHLFDPRIGVAYSINSKTAIRAAFGMSHPGGSAAGAGGPLVSASTSLISGYSSMDTPWLTGLLQPLKRSTQLMAPYSSFPQTLLGASVGGGLQAQVATYVEQWNVNLERSFGNSFTITTSYVGNKSVHNGSAISLGQMPDQYIQCNNVQNPTTATLPTSCGGHYLTDQIANPLFGIASPTGKAGSAKTDAAQFLLPYPLFTNAPSGVNHGQSSYNALLVAAKKRLPSAGVFTGSFTWAHSLNIGAVQDAYNYRASYGNAADDVPLILTMSYVTDLPVGKGKHFLSNANGIVDSIVGGWGLQGITQFASGLPLAFTENGGDQLTNAGINVGTIRPNVVPGVSKHTSGSRFQRINSTWFNTAAFTLPGNCASTTNCWSFGNESPVDSKLRQDSVKNWDMSLVKAMKFKEGISLQFRAEYFNVFNHPQYGVPNEAQGNAQFGIIPANTANGQTTGPQPRIGQLAMRLNF